MGKRWVMTGPSGPDTLAWVDYEAPEPRPGQATMHMRAAAMNPIDIYPPRGFSPYEYPIPTGHEGVGEVVAVGEGAHTDDGPLNVGDQVIVYGLGTWSTDVTVDDSLLTHRPHTLPEHVAAGVLLANLTAAEMVAAAGVRAGDTVLITAASGAVGTSAIQQAIDAGADRVIGTASPGHKDTLLKYGAEWVEYGADLAARVRAIAPAGVDAVLDAAGDDRSVDAAESLLTGTERLVTINAFRRAEEDGFRALGRDPESRRWRMENRGRIVRMAAEGKLDIPIAKVFPLTEIEDAVWLQSTRHAGGKIILEP